MIEKQITPAQEHPLLSVLGESKITTSTGRIVSTSLIVLIVINVAASVADTVASVHVQWGRAFVALEAVSVIIFTLEYSTRIIAYRNIRAVMRPAMVIDLLAILPWYLPLLLPVDLRILRLLRLVRLLRVLKLGRYSSALQIVGRVLRAKAPEMGVVSSVLLVLLLVSATLMYGIEHDAQPDRFGSIPDALWWGVVTLTTVGYGDIYPVTPLGKLFSAIMSLLAIGLFALPAGILGSGFVEAMQNNSSKSCPHCGKPLE